MNVLRALNRWRQRHVDRVNYIFSELYEEDKITTETPDHTAKIAALHAAMLLDIDITTAQISAKIKAGDLSAIPGTMLGPFAAGED